MPSYTLATIKEARDRVRQDMIDEQNAMYGTKLVTPQLLNGLEIEARLQTYLHYGLTLDELEPVAEEMIPLGERLRNPTPTACQAETEEPEPDTGVTPTTSDTD